MKAKKILKNIFYVGIKDKKRRKFDALIPLPNGTSYNSYLIKGKDKIALIDTVNPGFEKDFADNINKFLNVSDIDFVVMNHAEPDHAGCIKFILDKNKKAVLITSEKGSKMVQEFHSVPADRIKIVKENDTIDLGNKTLKFIDAAWLHWPETMFTYLVEDKILFSCDFFGAHTALGFYDDDFDTIPVAKAYYGEIMMPFAAMGKRALDKIANLEIKMIAPSHGPIYKNPQKILDAYKEWTSGKTKKKAVIAYVSMWKYTESMAKIMFDTLVSAGIETKMYDVAVADLGELAGDIVDSRAIVFGTPTLLGGIHPVALFAANVVKALRPPIKFAAVVGSYGWTGGAVNQAVEYFKSMNLEVVGSFEGKGHLSEDDKKKIIELGDALAKKINLE